MLIEQYIFLLSIIKIYRVGSLQFFYYIRGDIAPSQGAPPVSTTPVATSIAGVVHISGKFATDVNDTGSKFAAGVNNTGGAP